MTLTKAQQIGSLCTFIFAGIGSIPLFYFVSSNLELFNIEIFEDQITVHFFDLYIPLLIIFSIKFGRQLGERIFIKREHDVIYYTAQTILNTAGIPVILTFLLMRPYFLFMEWMDEGKMLSIYSFIIYLFYLFWDCILIMFSGIFIYGILLIPCAFAGLFCSFIFKLLRK